ncbi:MAG: 3-dehydroquinate synthase [Thermodesulfovibrionales bacterium]
MHRVRVSLGERSYEIIIGEKILERLLEFIRSKRYTSIGLVTNETLWDLYKTIIMELKRDLPLSIFIIPDGEQYKDILWFYHLHTRLLENRFDRSSCLIALGGGVVGDLTGFVASTYMRGIDYIQVPTTLLAQVDSSVGGKTAVNHPLGKNMIGTFYQPVFVLIDSSFLKTLPQREFRAGMAEIIKYAVIWDEELFSFLKKNSSKISDMDPYALTKIIARSCEIKAEVVSRDEREAGLRAILNYGHTIGHAIETVTGYRRFLHGEAVAMGMYAEALIASSRGLINISVANEINGLIKLYGLEPSIPVDLSEKDLISSMLLDKKAKAGRIRIVLPERIGKVTVAEIDKEEILRAINNARI